MNAYNVHFKLSRKSDSVDILVAAESTSDALKEVLARNPNVDVTNVRLYSRDILVQGVTTKKGAK